MKTYVVPTPDNVLLHITQADAPEEFAEMEVAAKTLEPITKIADVEFFETFFILDIEESEVPNLFEMLQAGVFMGHWLDAQETRFKTKEEN